MIPPVSYFDGDSEKDIIEGIVKGNENSFAQLYLQYKDKVYAISLRLCMSAEVAEDMVQEIFLKVWLNRDNLSEVAHFRAYLYTLSRNHIIRYLKKLSREIKEMPYNSATATATDADLRLIDAEYQAVFQRAIQSLPPQQAAVFKLSREHGYKRDEIALQLQISPDTVKTHLSKAIKNIRAFCLARLDLLLLLAFLKK